MNIPDMTAKMHKYFDYSVRCAQNKVNDDTGMKKLSKYERQVASLAGLAQHLGMFKDELVKLGSSADEEERDFYRDMMMRYEIAVDAMYVGGMLSDSAYKAIKSELTALSAGASDPNKNITLVFPEWNAPDDYEIYTEFKTLLDGYGLSWNEACEIIDETMRERAKNDD